MALKAPFLHPFSFVIFTLISFILIVSPINGHANSPSPSPSPSKFDPKTYLKRYGYLEYARANIVLNDEESDDEARIMESAIKTFQENFHIKPTGILDKETASAMQTPRCGLPDIINGANTMQRLNYSSKFTIFGPDKKWYKTLLSYLLQEDFPEAAKPGLERAMAEWESKSSFVFSDTEGFFEDDISIGFYSGEHGDGQPFDGPGNVLAHASHPENENKLQMHFDAAETWWYEDSTPSENAFDFQTTALHELGHVLGLDHSNVVSAIMYPTIHIGRVKHLDADDIEGIQYLYGH